MKNSHYRPNILSGMFLPVIITILAATVWLEAQSSASLQNNSSISGVVFDHLRRPVRDLWMELLDEVDTVVARTRTDNNGRYSFSRLSLGVFQVRVITAGTALRSETRRVQLNNISNRFVNEQMDFFLKPADNQSSGAAAAGTIFAQEIPEAARQAYDQALADFAAGKSPQEGIAKLSQAVQAFPTYFAALERLGVEHLRLGENQQAIPILKKAIEINPSGQDSLYALGVAQYRLRAYPESIDVLRKMVALLPASANTPLGYYFLGMAYLRNGQNRNAETQLKKAYELGSTSIPSDVHMGLAQIYSGEKRYNDAVRELELYLKETPDAKDPEKIRALIAQMKSK